MPQRVGMNLEEFVPSPFAALWSGVDAILFQDHLHGLARDTRFFLDVSGFLLPNPAYEGLVTDDRNKAPQLNTQLATALQ